MRKVIAISMPDEMHRELCQSISKTRYASLSEYIRELIRRDQAERLAEIAASISQREAAEPVEKRGSSTVFELGGLRFEHSSAADLMAEFARGDKTSSQA